MLITSYVRLDQAARMLETDPDTLLIAVVEGRLSAYWMFNMTLKAEFGRHEYREGSSPDESPVWMVHEVRDKHFTYLPLKREAAASLLTSSEYQNSVFDELSRTDENGYQWMLPVMYPLHRSHLIVTRDLIYFFRSDLEKMTAKEANHTEKEALKSFDDSDYVSSSLLLLNRAAKKWWRNADPNDPTTHPRNSDVASWLTDGGMSPTMANRAAMIIRPEWAHKGRKPDSEV